MQGVGGCIQVLRIFHMQCTVWQSFDASALPIMTRTLLRQQPMAPQISSCLPSWLTWDVGSCDRTYKVLGLC